MVTVAYNHPGLGGSPLLDIHKTVPHECHTQSQLLVNSKELVTNAKSNLNFKNRKAAAMFKVCYGKQDRGCLMPILWPKPLLWDRGRKTLTPVLRQRQKKSHSLQCSSPKPPVQRRSEALTLKGKRGCEKQPPRSLITNQRVGGPNVGEHLKHPVGLLKREYLCWYQVLLSKRDTSWSGGVTLNPADICQICWPKRKKLRQS